LTSLEPLDLVILSPVPRADGGASILSTRKCLYESVETVPFGDSSGDGPPRRESRLRSLNQE